MRVGSLPECRCLAALCIRNPKDPGCLSRQTQSAAERSRSDSSSGWGGHQPIERDGRRP